MQEIRIGHAIKRMLNLRRTTLKEVSRETGIPYSTLHTWLDNRQPKDILKVQRLATFFGISLSEILFDQSERDILNLSPQTGQPENIAAPSLSTSLCGTYEVIVRRVE